MPTERDLAAGMVGMVPVLIAAAIGATTLLTVAPASAVCSVFDKHPCAPTVCSVFQRRPCIPEIEYPLGQDLRLTIATVAAAENAKKTQPGDPPPEGTLDTIRDLFDALRKCWAAPAPGDARAGMEMSVRLSFKRSGEPIGPPRLTYVSPNATTEQRAAYRGAIDAALDRCSPMPFTKGLGGAIAGRPIAIRFIDDRILQAEHP